MSIEAPCTPRTEAQRQHVRAFWRIFQPYRQIARTAGNAVNTGEINILHDHILAAVVKCLQGERVIVIYAGLL